MGKKEVSAAPYFMNHEDLRLKNEEYTKAKLLPPAREELRFGRVVQKRCRMKAGPLCQKPIRSIGVVSG
jgi:hypothetical protein